MKGRRLEHDLGPWFQQHQFRLTEGARPADNLDLAGDDIDGTLIMFGPDLVSSTAGEHDFGEHQVGEGFDRRGQTVRGSCDQGELDAPGTRPRYLQFSIMRKIGSDFFMTARKG